MTKQTIKKYIPTIIVIVIIGAGSFYAGAQYGQNKTTSSTQGGNNFANMTPAERQARMANGGFGGQRGTRGNGGGITAGEILSKDDTSITVKLSDGGSKIVFITGSTSVTKTVTGSLADLMVGGQVAAMGTANPDGSISAQSIQIRTNISKPQGQ